VTEDSTVTGIIMTFSDPVQGADTEYDDWYQNVHLPQVCQIPGVRSGQRFRLVDIGADADAAKSSGPRNVAVYQVDADPRTVLAEIGARSRSGALDASPAIDRSSISATLWCANGATVFDDSDSAP
jgi:hypothetical protein